MALAVLLLALPAFGQECHGEHALPIVVNGADTPENVPDHIAYAHFIVLVTDGDRQAATVKALKFSPPDVGAVANAMRGVYRQLAFVDSEIKRQGTNPDGARLSTLRVLRTRIFDETTARLTKGLSPEGLAKLDDYIKTEIKPNIVIYGE